MVWRKEKQAYARFYDEELSKLEKRLSKDNAFFRENDRRKGSGGDTGKAAGLATAR